MGPMRGLTGLAHAQANPTVPTVAHANPMWERAWYQGIVKLIYAKRALKMKNREGKELHKINKEKKVNQT